LHGGLPRHGIAASLTSPSPPIVPALSA